MSCRQKLCFSHFSSVFKKSQVHNITQQFTSNKIFISFINCIARTDDVGSMHYIWTVHLCDVWHLLYGNIMNSSDQSQRMYFSEHFIIICYLGGGWIKKLHNLMVVLCYATCNTCRSCDMLVLLNPKVMCRCYQTFKMYLYLTCSSHVCL